MQQRRNVAEITDFIFPFHASQVGTSTSEQETMMRSGEKQKRQQ